jgi:hypothetical protein
MNWQKVNLHVENLIPGIVILTALNSVFKMDLVIFSHNDILIGAVFVATSYMVGALGNIFAYLCVNYISQITIRTPFLRFFARRGFERIANRSRESDNRRYSNVIDVGLSCGVVRIEGEVEKRRQTGRILRSTLAPVVLALVAIGQNACWSTLTVVLLCLAYYMLLLPLYAFAEVVVFKEALRGERVAVLKKNKKFE